MHLQVNTGVVVADSTKTFLPPNLVAPHRKMGSNTLASERKGGGVRTPKIVFLSLLISHHHTVLQRTIHRVLYRNGSDLTVFIFHRSQGSERGGRGRGGYSRGGQGGYRGGHSDGHRGGDSGYNQRDYGYNSRQGDYRDGGYDAGRNDYRGGGGREYQGRDYHPRGRNYHPSGGGRDYQSGNRDYQSGRDYQSRDYQSGGRDYQSGGRDYQSGGRDYQSGGRDYQSGRDHQSRDYGGKEYYSKDYYHRDYQRKDYNEYSKNPQRRDNYGSGRFPPGNRQSGYHDDREEHPGRRGAEDEKPRSHRGQQDQGRSEGQQQQDNRSRHGGGGAANPNRASQNVTSSDAQNDQQVRNLLLAEFSDNIVFRRVGLFIIGRIFRQYCFQTCQFIYYWPIFGQYCFQTCRFIYLFFFFLFFCLFACLFVSAKAFEPDITDQCPLHHRPQVAPPQR